MQILAISLSEIAVFEITNHLQFAEVIKPSADSHKAVGIPAA